MFRLSDAELFTKGAPPRTPFDRVGDELEEIARRAEKFDEQVAELREAEVRAGQRQATRKLKAIAPFFSARGVDPQDVKVLFDPIDYIVFRGLNADAGVKALELVDRAPDSARREKVRESLRKVIAKGAVEWATYRIDPEGRIERE
jgi:predicted Holliday junction resolvase-like endonuclease